MAREYQDLLAKEQEIENSLDQIKQEFMNTMQDAESIRFNHQALITWKKTKAISRFDGALFEKAHPDLYKQFQKVSDGSRRFAFKEKVLEQIKFIDEELT